MNASIIIPTRNRATQLVTCLKAVLKQTTPKDEVLVVDGGSTDNTRVLVKNIICHSRTPVVLLVDNRHGPSAARNTGIAKAQKKIIVFLDDDCLVSPGWLRNIQKICQKESAKTGFAFHHGNTRWRFRQKGSVIETFDQETKEGWKLLRYHLKKMRTKRIDFIRALNFFFRREVLQDFPALFDVQLFPFIGEERDLAARVQLAGYTILYEEKVRAIHDKRAFSAADYFLGVGFLSGRTEGILEKKYQAPAEIKALFSQEISSTATNRLNFFGKIKQYFLRAKKKSTLQKIFLFSLKEFLYQLGKLYGKYEYLYHHSHP